jgi:putative transposase
MANTYSQLYVHYVFAVQNRLCLIKNFWQDKLYKYMSGIIDQQGHKLYVINGMGDHLHIIISMNPKQAPSDLMYHLKRSSSMWINQSRLSDKKFSWQEGFGAFSLGKSQLPEKIKYIEEQQEHYKKKSFKEEYLLFLKENDIEYDERYIFKAIE